MQQQVAVITLGTSDLERSKSFYREGFGWTPVFENEEIAFYQMNGFVFGTWLKASLEDDTQAKSMAAPGAFTLAHNVQEESDVKPVIERLVFHGASLLREADAPPQGGLRGYISDPDGHIWEIAWNPDWPMDEKGHVTFAS
ncbi:VOC family protein [Paracoccus aurantiacus]|uniref:VOC family protein n=1 Tax=Paracoccus aurantiacus TaxID=2599412 RepID=A0A5C6S6N1_9RHOB|nr:VOC family protein [Paracoccus aurantiacus]TXB69987.1 VOC family protein [Paracoccus aurantiacus]